MFRKFLCFIGWHNFVWRLNGTTLDYDGVPPPNAKCKHCKIQYGLKQ